MKAKISFEIELTVIEGKLSNSQFKEWLEYQFGIRSAMREENPLFNFELRDAEIEPFYILNIND